MKRIRIVGLCLVAVFATSAVAASNASAKEFPLYVLLPGKTFPVKYHGLVTTPATRLETADGTFVECQKVHIEGEILSVHLTTTHYLFLECVESALGSKCTSSGAPTGDILLLAEEHLGLIDDPTGNLFNDTGVLVLLPSGFHFKCAVEIKVSGSVIGQIVSTIGQQEHETEFKYSVSSTKGMPLFLKFLSPLGPEEVEAKLTTEILGSSEESDQLGNGKILLLPATETVEIS